MPSQRSPKKIPRFGRTFPQTAGELLRRPLLNSRSEPLGYLALLHPLPLNLNGPIFQHYTSLVAVRVTLHLEQLQLENLLDQQIQTLKQTTENLPGVVYRFTADKHHGTRFTYISPQIDRAIGIDRDALLDDPQTLLEMIHPDEREGIRLAVESTLRNLDKFHWTGRVLINGEWRFLQLSSIPIKLPNGVVESSGYMTDVTDIKTTEEALRQSDEKSIRSLEGGPPLTSSSQPATSAQKSVHSIKPRSNAVAKRFSWLRTTPPFDASRHAA